MTFIPTQEIKSPTQHPRAETYWTAHQRLPFMGESEYATWPELSDPQGYDEPSHASYDLRRSSMSQSMGMLEQWNGNLSHFRRHMHKTLPLLLSGDRAPSNA